MGIGEGDVLKIDSRYNSPDVDFSPMFRLEKHKNRVRMASTIVHTKKVDHSTLANAFMNSNQVINYGLNTDQSTVRQGGLITSVPQKKGNMIYVKNAF